jgi:hypothetical protein
VPDYIDAKILQVPLPSSSIDLPQLTVEDVTDDAGHVVDEIAIRQQKTGEANVVGVSDYMTVFAPKLDILRAGKRWPTGDRKSLIITARRRQSQ